MSCNCLINKDYKISNRGYFINKKGFKITGTCNSDDVKITVLPIGEYGGKRKTVTIYKEVAKIFVKNLDPLNKKYVNHIKPSRFLTDARGLEWVTPGDNLKHYYDNKKTYYIIQKVDAKTQEILGEFNTPILAAKSIGKDSGSTIVKCIKGKRKTAYGFIWKEIANPHFKL